MPNMSIQLYPLRSLIQLLTHCSMPLLKCMMHSPCSLEFPNAPCMVNRKCSKCYPKDFCAETHLGEDGYPKYTRPDNGSTYTNPHSKIFDNCNVVPYNQYLSAKYDCHINFEVCASVKVIKYIHKYMCKGHDQMKYWNTLGPVTLVHWRLFGILLNSLCMKRSPLSTVFLFTLQISKPSISTMMMILVKLWTMMLPKRLSLLSGLLQIVQSLHQSSIPILTSPITCLGEKVQKVEATQLSQCHWEDVSCSPICRRTLLSQVAVNHCQRP